nr:immunoglobulin heavy chain junction region [Mus musculus]
CTRMDYGGTYGAMDYW